MAYIAFDEQLDTATLERTRARTKPVSNAPAQVARSGYTALEWSTVAIAEGDPMSSLSEPGRIAMALGALFGGYRSPRLADPRLEALRRMAVLSWHRGYVVESSEVKDFVAAGFTLDQYETLVDSISAGRAARNARLRRWTSVSPKLRAA